MNMETRKEFIQKKLREDDRWAIRALQIIYNFQTSQEQNQEQTLVDNGVGFSGVDAKFLSSLAKQYAKDHFLTFKQTSFVKRIMPRYWRQILQVAGVTKIDSLIYQTQTQGAAHA